MGVPAVPTNEKRDGSCRRTKDEKERHRQDIAKGTVPWMQILSEEEAVYISSSNGPQHTKSRRHRYSAKAHIA